MAFAERLSPNAMYGARVVVAAACAAIVTFMLLFTMQYLIKIANKELNEGGTRHMVDFVRVKKEEAIERKKRKPKKPPEPEDPPPEPLRLSERRGRLRGLPSSREARRASFG